MDPQMQAIVDNLVRDNPGLHNDDIASAAIDRFVAGGHIARTDTEVEGWYGEVMLYLARASVVPIHCLSCGASLGEDHADDCAWFNDTEGTA